MLSQQPKTLKDPKQNTLRYLPVLLISAVLMASCGSSGNDDSNSGDSDSTENDSNTDNNDNGDDNSTGDNSDDNGTESPETFVFPFRQGETWTICQGYNTPSLTHIGNEIHSLDFSIDPNSVTGVSAGCNFSSANVSTGRKVVAPVAATIVWEGLILGIGRDVVCLRLTETASNGANSMLLGHMTLDGLSVNDTVSLGQEIGTVNEASALNGQYAHIHVSMYESALCADESIPMNDVFNGDHNFTSDGSEQQWRGTEVSR